LKPTIWKKSQQQLRVLLKTDHFKIYKRAEFVADIAHGIALSGLCDGLAWGNQDRAIARVRVN